MSALVAANKPASDPPTEPTLDLTLKPTLQPTPQPSHPSSLVRTMPIELHDITGLVLAGGRGSRMGGVDKGLQTHGGIALAELTARRLAPQVGAVAINANRHLETYRAMRSNVWPDEQLDFAGPLAGIMAGLMQASTPYLATVPCDSPFFPHDLVARLADAMARQRTSIAMAFTHDGGSSQSQPVFCLMKTELREHLAAAMQRGQRKIMAWARELPLVEVMFDDAAAFINVNTLAELHALPRHGQDESLQSIANNLAGYDADALPIDVARAFLARITTPVDGVEPVPLRAALGRVLADDVVSPIDVPPHDNAAMDGYALRHADLARDVASELTVVGRSLAGEAWHHAVGPMQCVRIMTGAVMPPGLDTVVPQELVHARPLALASTSPSSLAAIEAEPERITVLVDAVRAGEHRRRAGEDLARGLVALRAGRVLRPADLGLLASLGLASACVRRRVRVAVVTTGTELRSAGAMLDAGAVYDSNRHTIVGMLERIGVEVLESSSVHDDPDALKDALQAALRDADAVITSGGVSVGDADHTRTAIGALGDVLFWNLAIRPGRPMAVGRIALPATSTSSSPSPSPSPSPSMSTSTSTPSTRPRPVLLFGLPGNPVAVMTTFYALIRDALLAMAGATDTTRLTWRATSLSAIRKRPGRTEFLRGIVAPSEAGALQVRLTGSQGSGILRSMSEANALIVLAHERGDVAPGEAVDVWPFDGLV